MNRGYPDAATEPSIVPTGSSKTLSDHFKNVIQLYTVEGRGGSSGRAIGYQISGRGFESQSGPCQFVIAPLCPFNIKWVARCLKTHKLKAAKKAMANYLLMSYAKNNQDPNSWFPDVWTEPGTHFTLQRSGVLN
ncbi:hypothetical protein PoB_007039300 [Plakobranchus ocellatus]|uniref:Uncharacterized protein n=1 Tax=Plakobranchus ocellatus TaxID=259542 RepID=A0AAV4DI40_9GAST|nr:hypothetical protein PoB_007039300 [Plakobranchus ocellatus]